MMALALLMSFAIVRVPSSEPSPTTWRQDRMAISMWVDPMVPLEQLPFRYAEMRAANFTAVMAQAWVAAEGRDCTPENWTCQMQRIADAQHVVDIADAAGLRTIMRAFSNYSGLAAAQNISRKESFLTEPVRTCKSFFFLPLTLHSFD